MKETMGIAAVLACGLSLLLVPVGVGAAEEEGQERTVERCHRAELFLGVAHDEESDEFAAGLAYEYRISSLLGVGAFIEHAGEEDGAWTFGVPLFVHPYKGVRFLLAPGWEVKEVKVEEGEGARDEGRGTEGTEDEKSFLVRAGVAYEFEVGRWSLTPEINADFVEGGQQVLVYGVSFGYGF